MSFVDLGKEARIDYIICVEDDICVDLAMIAKLPKDKAQHFGLCLIGHIAIDHFCALCLSCSRSVVCGVIYHNVGVN